jgi:hypothetical protein
MSFLRPCGSNGAAEQHEIVAVETELDQTGDEPVIEDAGSLNPEVA